MKFLAAVSQGSADSIFKKQNEPYLLDCILEQRNQYSKAKRIQAGQTWVVILFAVFSIISSAIGTEIFTATYGLLSVTLLIANKYLDGIIANIKQDAAAIQQFVDVVLYSAVLGNSELEWHYCPSRNDIAKTIGEYTDQERAIVKDWYSDYSKLTGVQQVFYCQNENVRWNKQLIVNYHTFQRILWGFVVVCAVVSFLVLNPTFIKMICVCTWLMPIVEYAVSIFGKIEKSIHRYESLEKDARIIENTLTSDENVVSALIDFQQKIYRNRRDCLLIPDWFYSLYKHRYQKKENRIARKISRG